MNRIEIKEKSKQDLGGKLFSQPWLKAVVVCFIYSLLTGAFSVSSTSTEDPAQALEFLSFIGSLGTVLSILTLPLAYGLAKFFLNVSRNNETKKRDLFAGYKENLIQNALTQFMCGLYVVLWALLFIIPGIIKAYSYSMALYLRNDNPEMEWKEAITESRKLMDGHKMELFILDLSFIGWYILGALCFGVGTLWVQAYHQTARANFYNEIAGR